MITITTLNGSKGRGETVEAACRDLVGDQRTAVRLGRAEFIPVEEATVADLRASGAVWVSKDRSWRVGALLAEVAET